MAWWNKTRRAARRTFDSQPVSIVQMFAQMAASQGTTATRSEALSIPAVLRGRNLICSVATLPLEQHGPDNAVEDSPLLRQIDPDVPNSVTLAMTVEDLLMDGIAWWEVTAKGFDTYPMSARRLDPKTVTLQNPADGRSRSPLPGGTDPHDATVWVDGEPVGPSRIIRFDSPNPALLDHAGRAIRRAILLDKAASMYADNPRPLDYFKPTPNGPEIEDEDVQTILDQWAVARDRRSTAWVPESLEYHSVDSPTPQQLQLAELSKQAYLEIANALGVDPEDLGISTTSRTYSNDVDRRRNKLNEVLAPFMRAITDRLSMGDVTRRGYTVRFNTTEYLLPNPTERWSTYQTAVAMGAMTLAEVREAEGLPPMEDEPMPEPEPAPVVEDAPAFGRPAQHTFDADRLTFADVPVATFSVDAEGRVIEGMALPYGKVATQNVRFAAGALQFDADNPGRVKLLRDHDMTAPLGKAIQLRDTPDGLLVRFKVARGAAGDDALAMAEDGVLDGLSVGVDFDARRDAGADPQNKGVQLVRRADLREVSLTAMPSFHDARVTTVAASRTQGGPVPDTSETVEAPEAPAPDTPDAPAVATFTREQVDAMLASVGHQPAPVDDGPAVVNPTRTVGLSRVNEPVPYRFDRGGNFIPTEHTFSTDLRDAALANDIYGQNTEAGRRVMGLIRATFDVATGNVDELNPTINRPDLYVDQRDYRYPLWEAVNKGTPPNGVQPFAFPKFASAAGLVAAHVETVEPASGTFVTTSQTVTPTAVSGKATITREVWDMGGNPAVSTLIWNQMVRGYREALETATATFLATLTAATDIALTTQAQDDALAAEWYAAVAGLQFIRGYDFDMFAVEQVLYKTFVDAVGADDRPLFPQINPQNANGTAGRRFVTLDLAGVEGVPSWALASTPGSSNNSWLFDRSVIHGWATAPQRLEFPGSGPTATYEPVAHVDLAIWGYTAFANTDIGGVRQVTYDSTT